MHDIKAIRDNPEAFDKGLGRRGMAPLAANILSLDQERRRLIQVAEEMQGQRNSISREIGKLKAAGDEIAAAAASAEVSRLKEAMPAAEAAEREAAAAIESMLATIPNLPAADVPDGADETANLEIRRHGTPPRLNSAKEHYQLGEALGLMDFEAAAKMSGARFVVLKGAFARLERALASFMLDIHTGEFGYTEIVPPHLVRDRKSVV